MSTKGTVRAKMRGLISLLVPCFMLLFSLSEGCVPEPKQEKKAEQVIQEPAKEVPARAEPRTEPVVTKEEAPAPREEPKKEAKAEPKQEKSPGEPGKDSGPMEPAKEPVQDAGPTGPCLGGEPPYPDAGATAPPEITVPESFSPDERCKYYPAQCKGAPTPRWSAEDFQPQSCGYKQKYGLNAFRGYVTVVAFLSGW